MTSKDTGLEMVICGDCNGSGEGSRDGTTCKTCGGLGEVWETTDLDDEEPEEDDDGQ